MLNSVTIMGFVETFWLNEHLIAFQQTMDPRLTDFRSFLAFEFCGFARIGAV